MPTATVYRDGKAIRTTSLSADQARDFVILADAVRAAQSVMRNKTENSATGGIDGVSHRAGIAYSERRPDDIYAVLPRLAELLGTHARAVYSHLDEAINGEVIRNADGTPEYGLKLARKNTPIPAPFHPAAALASQASALGMIPLDGLAFDRTELTDPPPAPVVTTGGAVVGNGNVPQLRAYVRWCV
ncbi:MAG: hypothetical protein LDL19_00195 [Thiobacillus sp.]|nr:hypothetical protein [Thiobacillus sp.]